MKKQIIMILLVFSTAPLLYAVEQYAKTIEFSDNYYIYGLKTSENYFCIRLHDYSTSTTMAVVYDKEGEELFRKGRAGKDNIIFASPVERFDSFIVIYRGRDETQTKDAEDDTVKAYDLHTGDFLWQSYSLGSDYAISPDRRYLLPQEPAEPDRGIKLNIIDLRDGAVFTPAVRLRNIHASWYDSTRIILISQEYEPNPNRAKNSFELLDEKMMPLLSEKNYILSSLKRPQLPEKDKKVFQQRFDAINSEFDKIAKEREEIQKSLPPRGRERRKIMHPVGSARVRPKPLVIKIYNWRTDQIEQERKLDGLYVGGDTVTVVYKQQGDGSSGLTVDAEGDIYLVGSYKIQKRENIILKLDYTLNLDWKYSYSYFGLVTKFFINGKPWFRIGMPNDKSFVFLDPKNGEVLTPSQITHISKQAGDFDFSIYPPISNDVKTQAPAIVLPQETKIRLRGNY